MRINFFARSESVSVAVCAVVKVFWGVTMVHEGGGSKPLASRNLSKRFELLSKLLIKAVAHTTLQYTLVTLVVSRSRWTLR